MQNQLNLTEDLSATASEGLKIASDEVTNHLALNIQTISKNLIPRIQHFRQKFNHAYNDFVAETEIDVLKQAIEPDFKHGIKVKLSNQQIKTKSADLLAATMLEGLQLLNEIRSILTGTTIQTHFYYKGDHGIIPIKISDLKPVLSLYAASGTLSNPINLAFQINGEIIDLSGELVEEKENNYDLQHYLTILDRAKDLYVNDLNSKNSNRIYEKYWDNKDAEILELLIQRKAKTLAWTHYKKYRQSMGSAGKQTTLLQMGDIGNIQVKYFGQKQKQVNVMRFSMLRNQLFELENIFLLTDPVLQKQKLKTVFLPKTTEMHDEFSKQLNRSATEYFNQLFQNLTI